MWRRAEVMRRLSVACGCLLLASCATTRVSHVPLTAAAQETFLGNLSDFQLEGRAGVRAGGEGFNIPSVSWRQAAAESRLKLRGTLGVGSLTLVYGPQTLHVTTSRGEELEGDEAKQALSAQLGFVPPFEALRYWVLGVAAPGEPPTEQAADADGHIVDMTQLQWRIRYDRWADVPTRDGVARLPKRLVASRADLRLTLFIDRWKLQAGH
jgi:outer membrane lipoprotein LolB